ncbi:hypothetical protein V500_00365 [Pseudogymnoascus sp. VKM F-4518 (FW-2643)]|nr:hypothetical protein V500_00365 [Pseudogymnoascus sp. VKM F-4518 (FW-2643)]
MRVLGILVSIATLVHVTLAQGERELVEAFTKVPSCAQKCSVKTLGAAKCELLDVRNCFCADEALQLAVSVCVVETCTVKDQSAATIILQTEICNGIPHPSRSAEIIRDVIIIASITFPIIALRFISRSLVSNRLWLDDWAVVVAAILMVPMVVIPIYNATLGFGKHFWDVNPDNVVILRKLYYISQILYILVQGLAKVSILLLYLRIFPDRNFRRIIHIALVWMAARTIIFVCVIVFQCIPVAVSWDQSVVGKCADQQAFVYAGAAVSIFEDIVIMFLPVYELNALTLSLKKRLVLVFMFALGSFASITSIIRLKYIVSYGTTIDLTYANVDPVIWSILESFTAIICASLMCLRPLIVKIVPKSFPSTEMSEATRTPTTPGWAKSINVKLASKMRHSSNRFELHSQGGEGLVDSDNVIRVQKSWVTETHPARTAESLEMKGRSSCGTLPTGKNSWDQEG